jgi:hypothetical protein
MMRRRQFITLLGGALATWPLAVRAQQREKMRRIGVLIPATADDPDYQARVGYRAGACDICVTSTTCDTTGHSWEAAPPNSMICLMIEPT